MVQVEAASGSAVNISCSRDELAQRLGLVSRAVSTRTAVQILSGVLLRAESGRVTLAATDMEVSLRAQLEARAEGDGAVVVPGKLLVELTRLLPDDEVRIESGAEESVVRISCGSASYQLNSYNPEDFPRLPSVEGTQTFGVDGHALLETAARVGRAASRDESRPVLTGVLMRFEGDKLIMAATDSYRLSVQETVLGGSTPDLEAIVPARSLTELARIAQGADTVEIGIHENQVLFAANDIWLTTRRIDGQFPNYKQLLPETFEHELTLPRGELLEVVRRTAVLAQRNSPLRLRFAEGELTVSAQTHDVGEARESLPVSFTGEPLEIGFNAEFLRDGIESLDDDELRLRLISPLRPGLIQSAAGNFSYLIMPIRLAG
ncbi:MAG: DNA polymerase III subunit beta [Actinobacteria bacterium]|nr:DNA polymerase III subunit beta [Actinomycetota bacterium]